MSIVFFSAFRLDCSAAILYHSLAVDDMIYTLFPR